MDLHSYFRAIARYHAWATDQLLDAYLAPLSDQAWRGDCGLFFHSVHGTVNHLLVCDSIWYARLAENHSLRIALDAELHAERAAVCQALRAAAARWGAWLDTLDAARLSGELAYTRNNGQLVRVPFATALGHAFNHGTHHRGQISAALTALGHTCPELDWIYRQQQEMRAPDGIPT
jgi:uncharacterized damage-inducible protein DinB